MEFVYLILWAVLPIVPRPQRHKHNAAYDVTNTRSQENNVKVYDVKIRTQSKYDVNNQCLICSLVLFYFLSIKLVCTLKVIAC